MSVAEREVDSPALPAGVHPIGIPTPFALGELNAWLIEGSPLTLIDTGPNWASALEALEAGLARHGYRVEDLELLVLTHQHSDHAGLAGYLARRSGAEVAALDRIVELMRTWPEHGRGDDVLAGELLLRHGVELPIVQAMRGSLYNQVEFSGRVEITRPLAHGEQLVLGDRTLRVLHRPGHSPSDIQLLDEERSVMFGGDHLLGHVPANPLIQRAIGGPSGDPGSDRPTPLITYQRSLQATIDLAPELLLPGHGPLVTDVVSLANARLTQQQRRTGRIVRMVAEEPLTGAQIAGRFWGQIAELEPYRMLSEVLSHADPALAAGELVELKGDDGIVRLARPGD